MRKKSRHCNQQIHTQRKCVGTTSNEHAFVSFKFKQNIYSIHVWLFMTHSFNQLFWWRAQLLVPWQGFCQTHNAAVFTVDHLLSHLSSNQLVNSLITASVISQLLYMTWKYILVFNILIKNKSDNLTTCNSLKIRSSALQYWSQGSLGTQCPHSLPNTQLPLSFLNSISIHLETVNNWFNLKHALCPPFKILLRWYREGIQYLLYTYYMVEMG